MAYIVISSQCRTSDDYGLDLVSLKERGHILRGLQKGDRIHYGF